MYDKILKSSQYFQWKYPQKSLLGIFLDVTLFLNMITMVIIPKKTSTEPQLAQS